MGFGLESLFPHPELEAKNALDGYCEFLESSHLEERLAAASFGRNLALPGLPKSPMLDVRVGEGSCAAQRTYPRESE